MAEKERPKASAEAATEAELHARGDAEREAVQEQTEAVQTAEERREAQQERASTLKSVPEGALPPSEKTTKGGETTFARARFLDPYEGPALTGHEAHVIAGALHLDDAEYLSVADVQQKVETWLATPVTTGESDQG